MCVAEATNAAQIRPVQTFTSEGNCACDSIAEAGRFRTVASLPPCKRRASANIIKNEYICGDGYGGAGHCEQEPIQRVTRQEQPKLWCLHGAFRLSSWPPLVPADTTKKVTPAEQGPRVSTTRGIALRFCLNDFAFFASLPEADSRENRHWGHTK